MYRSPNQFLCLKCGSEVNAGWSLWLPTIRLGYYEPFSPVTISYISLGVWSLEWFSLAFIFLSTFPQPPPSSLKKLHTKSGNPQGRMPLQFWASRSSAEAIKTGPLRSDAAPETVLPSLVWIITPRAESWNSVPVIECQLQSLGFLSFSSFIPSTWYTLDGFLCSPQIISYTCFYVTGCLGIWHGPLPLPIFPEQCPLYPHSPSTIWARQLVMICSPDITWKLTGWTDSWTHKVMALPEGWA